jgi:hypothetical protein
MAPRNSERVGEFLKSSGRERFIGILLGERLMVEEIPTEVRADGEEVYTEKQGWSC